MQEESRQLVENQELPGFTNCTPAISPVTFTLRRLLVPYCPIMAFADCLGG